MTQEDLKRSSPDYGVIPSRNPVVVDTDTAELAVRLGSPVIHSRTGRVVFYEDFQGVSIPWDYWDTTSLIVAGFSRQGISCLRLVPSPLNGEWGIAKRITFEFDNRGGSEVCFGFLNATDLNHFEFRTQYSEHLTPGGAIHQVRIYYDDATGVFSYYDSAGAFIPFLTIPVIDHTIVPTPRWHSMKVTYNFSSREYLTFVWDSYFYQFPAGTHYRISPAVTTEDYEWVQFDGNHTIGTPNRVYVQSVIMTVNEP